MKIKKGPDGVWINDKKLTHEEEEVLNTSYRNHLVKGCIGGTLGIALSLAILRVPSIRQGLQKKPISGFYLPPIVYKSIIIGGTSRSLLFSIVSKND